MPASVLSERDLEVLRSFARRIDPADSGAQNNLGVLYYRKGLITDAIVAGSDGCTPKSWDLTRRVTPRDAAIPTSTPADVSTSPRRMTIRDTSI